MTEVERVTDPEVDLYISYIKLVEELVSTFQLMPLDDVTTQALDAAISLACEENFPEIERSKIHTNILKHKKRIETYILIHRKDRDLPFTFKTVRPLNNKILKTIKK